MEQLQKVLLLLVLMLLCQSVSMARDGFILKNMTGEVHCVKQYQD